MVNRRATRVFGHVAPEIVKVEYDPAVMEAEEVVVFGDADLPPFALGQYVANGSVAMTMVEEEGRGTVANLAFDTDESVVYWQAPFGFDLSAFSTVSFDPNSDATMFSSITPRRILFSKFFINLVSSINFPAPNISSSTILIESVTEALPPM